MFFSTRAPQGGFSCRFAAIHLLSSEKTIKIYFEPAGSKVCDAFWCFLKAALPPVLCNAILIGALIAWEEAGVGNGFPPAFFYNALTVGAGEAVACYVLGIPLLGVMQKHLKLN